MNKAWWLACAVLIYFFYLPITAVQAVTIVSTSTVNVSARVPGPEDEVASSTPSSGGGGGGGSVIVNTQLVLSGVAYPLARLVLWRNGVSTDNYSVGLDGKFKINLSNVGAGWLNLVIYAQDSDGAYAKPYSLPVYLTAGAITNVEGIVIAPTISADQASLKQGQWLKIFGQTAPESQVAISVEAVDKELANIWSDALGRYSYNLSTDQLKAAYYQAWSRVYYKNREAVNSKALSFLVLEQPVDKAVDKPASLGACELIADFNNDCKVNLVDFSIAAYWYKRASPPSRLDLHKNGRIDLADLSIMAYYWTG